MQAGDANTGFYTAAHAISEARLADDVPRIGADVDRRISQCRLAVWLACGLLTFLFLRGLWPLAWQVAAFGGGVSLLWPFVRRSESKTCDPLCHAIEIGLDLLIATVLIAVSGGFSSPFASLVFVVVLEAYALLGRRAAIYTALAAALLNLAHFRSGLSVSSAILYGLATGTLFVAALLAGLSQARPRPQESANAHKNNMSLGGSSLLAPASIEEMQEQLDAAERAGEQIRDKYREVTHLHRDQRAQILRMRVSEQLWEASVRQASGDGGGMAAYARVLRLVMEMTEAGGGVLWLRAESGNALVPQSCEGRVSDSIRREKILHADTLTSSELRARCEAVMQGVAPPPLRASVSRIEAVRPRSPASDAALNSVVFNSAVLDEDAALLAAGAAVVATLEEGEWILPVTNAPAANTPAASSPPVSLTGVGVVIVRGEGLGEEPGGIIGAIGICDPRAQGRFLASELERLQSLSRPLAQALCNIGERVQSASRIARLELLRDMHELRESRPAREEVYRTVVALVMQNVPCDNCTLFLLDEARQHLQPRATQGRVVDLLDHIVFERGAGVSGWVAARGKPLHIPDLTRETNLLDVETLPSRVRSFVAMPLCVQGRIVGVLNVSHAQAYAFSPSHIALLSLLADQAALALESSQE